MQNGYEIPNTGGPTIANKLTATLIGAMRDGIFAGCDRLPPEGELAASYGVSRTVIRDVLANLEREGFVQRGRGVGTKINTEIVEMGNRLDLKFEYLHLVAARGAKPTVDRVFVTEEPADESLAERLALDIGAPIIFCRKRVLASGVPVIYSEDRLPKHIFKAKNYQSYDWSRPVYDIMEECCGITVDTDIARVSPTNASPAVRKELDVKDGEALLLIDEVGYYRLKYPAIQTFAYYTNFFDFTILRKKL